MEAVCVALAGALAFSLVYNLVLRRSVATYQRAWIMAMTERTEAESGRKAAEEKYKVVKDAFEYLGFKAEDVQRSLTHKAFKERTGETW